MANDFYTVSGSPSTASFGSSAIIRGEFTLIKSAFDKLAGLTGNSLKILRVNSGESAYEAVAVTGTGSVVMGTSPTIATPTFTGTMTMGSVADYSTSGTRIKGDFSNVTRANRVMFMDRTAGSGSNVGVMPNGAGTTGAFTAFAGSDPDNTNFVSLTATTSVTAINSAAVGTGVQQALQFQINGVSKFAIDASGNSTCAGTLGVTGAATLAALSATSGTFSAGITATTGAFSSTLSSTSDFAVNTNKFNVTASSGNVAMAGDLTCASIVASGNVSVTGTIKSSVGITAQQFVATPAGGSVAGIFMGASLMGLYWGSGVPTVTAPLKGALYLRTDGTGTNDRAYISTGGSSWTALVTVA